MCGRLLRLHHVWGASALPLSHPLSAEPHTTSLSWHHSRVCYQMSSPYASVGPAQIYLCLRTRCGPIYLGSHGDWQRYGGAYWPHHTAQGRHPHQMPECVHHFRAWISQLEDQHIQSCRSQPLLLPTPSAAPVMVLMVCGLACSGVTIKVWPVW